jgi:NAD(P)-dependent dehydrogenase (short-subunit alcohol dehydrogenase family)
MSAAAAKRTVLILGAGPGTGASLAHAFARAGHPVALASRTLPSALADEINAAVPQQPGATPLARAWSVDASRSADVARFVADAQAAWPEARPWAGVWNPTGGFGMRKYLDWSEEHVREAFEVQV